MRRFNHPYLFVGFSDDKTSIKYMMEQYMDQLSHTDGLKSSLWIDPSRFSPRPWPSCGHVASFVKSRASRPSPSVPQGLTREETIWQVYLDWILCGKVNEDVTQAAECKTWTTEDERSAPVNTADNLTDYGGQLEREAKL